MAPRVARPVMRKPLIAGLSKPGNGSAHYLKGTEKGKPTLFQCPPHRKVFKRCSDYAHCMKVVPKG